MKLKDPVTFTDILILLVILLSYIFLAWCYNTTVDATMKGVILTGVITTLGTCINWRFGSSKSSVTKDETIASLQQTNADNTKPTVIADTVNADTVQTLNSENTNVSKDNTIKPDTSTTPIFPTE